VESSESIRKFRWILILWWYFAGWRLFLADL
jgi:hypothetical protein